MLLFFLYEMFPVPFQPSSVHPFFWLGGRIIHSSLYTSWGRIGLFFFFPPVGALNKNFLPLSKNINCHLSTSFHLISFWVLSAWAVTSPRRFSRAHSVEGESGGVRRASLTAHRKWAGNWNRRPGTRALGLINRRLMDVDVVPFLITMGTTKACN